MNQSEHESGLTLKDKRESISRELDLLECGILHDMASRQMSIPEIASAMNVSPSTVERAVRSIFPESIRSGVKTLLGDEQVTAINKHIRSNRQLVNPAEVTTDLEMSEMTVRVLQFHIQKSKRLENENAALLIEREMMLPKVESAEALTRCDKNMCITEAAKHFGLQPKLQVFPYLRARGYLTSKDLPTQDALDAGVLAVRQSKDRGGEFHSQAVVEKSALELWRTVIVPRIIKWSAEQ